MILVDTNRLRQSEPHVHGMPELDSLGNPARWRVCPECLWLTISYLPGIVCGRPPGQEVHYGGGLASITHPACSSQPLKYLPEDLERALSSTYMIGGTNAVLDLVRWWTAESIGLPSSLTKYLSRYPTKRLK